MAKKPLLGRITEISKSTSKGGWTTIYGKAENAYGGAIVDVRLNYGPKDYDKTLEVGNYFKAWENTDNYENIVHKVFAAVDEGGSSIFGEKFDIPEKRAKAPGKPARKSTGPEQDLYHFRGVLNIVEKVRERTNDDADFLAELEKIFSVASTLTNYVPGSPWPLTSKGGEKSPPAGADTSDVPELEGLDTLFD